MVLGRISPCTLTLEDCMCDVVREDESRIGLSFCPEVTLDAHEGTCPYTLTDPPHKAAPRTGAELRSAMCTAT